MEQWRVTQRTTVDRAHNLLIRSPAHDRRATARARCCRVNLSGGDLHADGSRGQRRQRERVGKEAPLAKIDVRPEHLEAEDVEDMGERAVEGQLQLGRLVGAIAHDRRRLGSVAHAWDARQHERAVRGERDREGVAQREDLPPEQLEVRTDARRDVEGVRHLPACLVLVRHPERRRLVDRRRERQGWLRRLVRQEAVLFGRRRVILGRIHQPEPRLSEAPSLAEIAALDKRRVDRRALLWQRRLLLPQE
eukprot:7210656-Prymnesium_polylepis.1